MTKYIRSYTIDTVSYNIEERPHPQSGMAADVSPKIFISWQGGASLGEFHTLSEAQRCIRDVAVKEATVKEATAGQHLSQARGVLHELESTDLQYLEEYIVGREKVGVMGTITATFQDEELYRRVKAGEQNAHELIGDELKNFMRPIVEDLIEEILPTMVAAITAAVRLEMKDRGREL